MTPDSSPSPALHSVSVLGLGRMGHALASRLLVTGHAVTVWNRSPGQAAELVAQGAREADSIGEATDKADLVITFLATDDAVRQVALRDDGVVDHLGEAIYVDASTISPALSAELADACPRFVAMPVLGGPKAVQEGQAVYLVGGDDELVRRLDPLLGSLSASSKRYASAPLASAAKLTINLLLLNGVVALAEGVTAGRAGGLSDEQLIDLIGASPMVAPGLRNRLETIVSGDGPTWWTTTLGAKDATLAVHLAESAGHDLPVTAAVRARFTEAAAHGLADLDIAFVNELYR
jgi:3-hydroxyisobutyrate dehydrogenase-like beta-hydroxyacid dehydrogenase